MTLRHFDAYLDQPQQLNIRMPKGFPHQQIAFVLEEMTPTGTQVRTWIEAETEDAHYVYFQLWLQEPLDLEKRYRVYDSDRNSEPLTYRQIVRSQVFDQIFDARNISLGSHYKKSATTFRLWAPISEQVYLQLESDQGQQQVPLTYTKKGVWEISLAGDWEGARYRYLHKVNGHWQEVHDPYATSSTSNSGASYVINPAKLKKVSPLKKQAPKSQAIIYEMSVRDFTSQDGNGFKHQRRFQGLSESPSVEGKSLGQAYIKELGVTHIQLMPVYDFGSVDEDAPRLLYNWGYDPVQYNVPEGSFASDPDDPYARITELQAAVASYHKLGIGVIMDVVYNHVYDIDAYAFEKLVPGYCYRVTLAGDKSNGSWCGNDLASERLMVRDYIVTSLRYWQETFGMDGFRFDLMGLIDRETMTQAANALQKAHPGAYLYGEGWDMPTALDTTLLAHQNNADRLPAISFFNDSYRDTFKQILTQPHSLLEDSLHQQVENLLSGSIGLSNQKPRYLSASQSVNYLECHDNATFFDYIRLQLPSIRHEWQKHMARFGLQLQLLSQGMTFIHSGQEFYRTKNHLENSYNSPDSINRLDWKRRLHYDGDVRFIQDLIAFRKNQPLLALNQANVIEKSSQFYWLNPYVLRYNLYHKKQDLEIVINFAPDSFDYPNQDQRQLLVKYPQVGQLGHPDTISIPGQSLIVLEKD